MLQTEFPFTLPRGYVDQEGNLHREGAMRLATALDEIIPLRDARVRSNDAYLSILILARVVTRLGSLNQVNVPVIEQLFTADLTYLQELYRQLNEAGGEQTHVTCPNCSTEFEVEPGGVPGPVEA